MFSALSGHPIIVPIMTVVIFYECVCVSLSNISVFCMWFAIHCVCPPQGPTHTSFIALIPLFMKSPPWPWTSQIMHVCVFVHVCVWRRGTGWRQAIVEPASASELWKRKDQQLKWRQNLSRSCVRLNMLNDLLINRMSIIMFICLV